MTGYTNSEALVETDWLSTRLDDPKVVVIEVDEDTAAFDDAHIPGAVALNWETELQAPPRRDFVSGDDLATPLAAKGANDTSTMVLYGGNNNWFAAYAFWLMKYRGIDNVTLLNGGRTKWELEGRPMTKETTEAISGTLSRGSDRPALRVFRDDVVAVGHRGTSNLIDVRSPAEFTGEVLAPPHLPKEQPYVPGHVPGAANIPWSQAANEDGSFKSAAELQMIYEGAGTTPDREVVAYCRIGERSSHTWFVLSELLGYPNLANYDGSWTEYGSLVGAPVELGVAS